MRRACRARERLKGGEVKRTILTICGVTAVAPAWAQQGEPFALDRIVISAGAGRVQSETPQAVTILDREDLDIAQPTTIGDALRTIPGVSPTGSDRVLGEGFNIRGFGSDLGGGENRLILQVDGATKYYQQYRMGSLFTEPELYKRVEVLRGPASSTLYGSGAIAGTITLETRDASDFLAPGDPFGLRQKVEGTTNGAGFLTSTIVAAQPAEGLELLGAFIYRDNDDIEDGNGDTVPGTAFSAPSGLAKARYAFGPDRAHDVFASYQLWTTDDDRAEYEQTATSPFFGQVDREVTDRTATLGYGYAPPANPLVDFEIVGGYSDTEVVQENATAPIPSVLFEDSEYAYETWQLRAENTARLGFGGGETYLTTGVQWSEQTRIGEAESGFIPFQPGGEDTKLAAYAQAEIYAGGWLVIPGLRVERSELEADRLNASFAGEEVSNTAVSPKLALLYKLTETWNLFGSVAYTERLPTLDEVFDGSTLQDGGPVVGNLELESEEAITYEVGASFSATGVLRGGDQMVAKATLFRSDVENLIEGGAMTGPFRNVGEARIGGLEIEGAYEAERVFGRLGLSVIRGDDEAADEPLDSIPADELALTVGTRLPAYDLELGWRSVFAARQDDLPAGEVETPGYGVHDVYARWTPGGGPLDGAEVQFGVENVFDKLYRRHLANDPAPGRTFTLTLAKLF